MAMKDDNGDVDVLVEKVRGKRDDASGDDGDQEESRESKMEKAKESAIADLFDAMGVEDGDEGKAMAALEDFVRACMKGYGKE